ncbi:hypothetical protein NC796_21930 [Aliifodinibius sp. S!AR15-10]|uniref:hypothetical protein n=1 Tax=Aliifodinibius sp. S!AR15-10 TaxID=2950437 RepID=UPI002865B36B|nr:hypothetical protein [Aliifodinibius sp. S!AR15-10]MDR8393828.1 hypothetical protein [Aliifodinibius sp. S!AR15-10]
MNRPIVEPSGDDNIYLARTKHFLIEKLDPNGNYIRAFYYPVKRKKFSPQDAIQATEEKYVEYVSEWRVSVIKNADEENIPDKWPALNTMLIDDKNRIWASLIVNNEEVYQWWVLENSGKLIVRFTWPRSRSIEVVKDGYLYAKKTDEETGLAKVVRYRIDMQSN